MFHARNQKAATPLSAGFDSPEQRSPRLWVGALSICIRIIRAFVTGETPKLWCGSTRRINRLNPIAFAKRPWLILFSRFQVVSEPERPVRLALLSSHNY